MLILKKSKCVGTSYLRYKEDYLASEIDCKKNLRQRTQVLIRRRNSNEVAQSPSIITKLPNYQIAVLFFYSLGRSATIRLCNTFSIEKILLVMRHKQILSQGLIKGCSLVCCDTRSQDIVCTSADVHPVLQGNLCRVFRRYRDIQSDSDNRNGLAPDSLGFVQVHFSQ